MHNLADSDLKETIRDQDNCLGLRKNVKANSNVFVSYILLLHVCCISFSFFYRRGSGSGQRGHPPSLPPIRHWYYKCIKERELLSIYNAKILAKTLAHCHGPHVNSHGLSRMTTSWFILEAWSSQSRCIIELLHAVFLSWHLAFVIIIISNPT